MTAHIRQPNHSYQSGFSLMELAIVLMIIGTLTGGILVSVSQSLESGRRTNALNQLRQIEEALYGFAASSGRLPCPAAADGLEDCGLTSGFLPVSLGLYGNTDGNGILLDPWQNAYRYTVDDSGVFTDVALLRAQFGAAVGVLVTLCSANTCGVGEVLSTTIPAVVVSQGANWATFSSTNETENIDGDQFFVNTTYSEDNFDDQLIWLSPYVLFNRMVSAGRLP